MQAARRRRQPSTPSSEDEDGDDDTTNDYRVDDDSFEPSKSDSLSPAPPERPDPPPPPPPVERPISRADRRDLLALLNEVNDEITAPRIAHNNVHPRAPRQPFPLSLERTTSASGSASTSTSGPESAARRFTAQEKGKGRAVISSPIAIEDDEVDGGDGSIRILGVKRKRTPSDVIVVHEAGGLGEDEERGLGSFSELTRCVAGVGLMRRSLSGMLRCP